MKHDLTTCHCDPWCLIYRGGDTAGKRRNTRMAYLKGTVVENGKAVALTGYIMNSNMEGWTKSVRRIEWYDVAKRFRGWNQPAQIAVRKAKAKVPVASFEAPYKGYTAEHAAFYGKEGVSP